VILGHYIVFYTTLVLAPKEAKHPYENLGATRLIEITKKLHLMAKGVS